MKQLAPLALVVLWSSGFVGATLAAPLATPETTLLWRYVPAAVVLVVVVGTLGRRYSPTFLAREAVLGLLGQCGYLLGVFYAADLGAATGTSALVASLQPALVAVLLAALGERGGLRQAGGLLLGLTGVTIVVGSTGGGAGAGLLATALGMLSLSAATLVAHRWAAEPGRDVLDSLAVQSVVAVGFFLVLGLARGAAAPPQEPAFWVAVAWLIVLAFGGGYGSYLLVLRESGPVAVSAWLYLTPGTTAIWAALMFGEALTGQTLLGLAVAVVGVAAVLPTARSRGSSSESPRESAETARSRGYGSPRRPRSHGQPVRRRLPAVVDGAAPAQVRRSPPEVSIDGCTL